MTLDQKIKQKEKVVVDWLNTRFKLNVKLVDDKFSSYDLEDEKHIFEIKHRFGKVYATKLIESMKLSVNYQKSQLLNKKFIYIVIDENGLTAFNITEKINEIIKLPEYNKLMEHNHYYTKTKIFKLHRNLPKKFASLLEVKI